MKAKTCLCKKKLIFQKNLKKNEMVTTVDTIVLEIFERYNKRSKKIRKSCDLT
jgi:hypothetical protein